MEIAMNLLLNLPHLQILDCVVSDKEAHIYCESTENFGLCPVCQQKCVEVQMYQERTLRDMALLGRKVFLHLKTRQFKCQHCRRYFNESFDFVDKNATMTIRYEQYLYFMLENICISDLSVKEDIAWSSAQRIYKKYADKTIAKRDVWQKVRYLGIDEISVKKGHKNYACVLVDLETGQVLDFLENRLKETIEAYFKHKGAMICNQIEVISSDMWDAYSNLAGALFPNAISVIDRFHFFVHLNKALDASRKALRKDFPEEVLFKNLRWALLKNPNDLSKEEQEMLQKVFLLSPELSTVYALRKELKDIFDLDISKEEAKQKVEEWEKKATALGSKPVNGFMKTLYNWKDKVLNFFHQRITNATVEGLNNAIRGIIRRSFGFHNFQNLKRRILVELG
jgi:transposase